MVSSSRKSGLTANHRLVIDLLLHQGAASRLELTRTTGLSKPTVSGLVADLLADGTIREIGPGSSTGGRRPMLLRLGGGGRAVVGIELDASLCRAVLVDLDGRVLSRADLAVTSTAVEDLCGLIEQGVAGLLSGREPALLLGCGIGVPGLIDTAGNTVTYADSLGWDSVELRQILEDRLGLAVRLTDRGKAAALGTLWLTGRETQDDLIYIYLGTGVGGGLILGNSLRLGASHSAGEIGHVTVLPDGPLCKCGNRGCLETLVSGPAIAMRCRAKIREGRATVLTDWLHLQNLEAISAKLVARAALEGDELALEVMHETAEYLGIAIANLVNLLNPQTVILGGPVSRWGGLLLPAVSRELAKRALPVAVQAVQLVTSETDDDAVAVGAAALILQEAGTYIARSTSASSTAAHRGGLQQRVGATTSL